MSPVTEHPDEQALVGSLGAALDAFDRLRRIRPGYAEGRGIRIAVRGDRDVEVVERLLAIKLEPR